MQLTRLRVILLLLLAVSLTGSSVWYVMATSSPTRNTTIEPGISGPFTDNVYLDGTTPVDHPSNGGANTVGTAGQDFTTFLTSIVSNGKSYFFEPGTYVQKTQFVLNNGQNIVFAGLLGQTIFQQASSSNVQSMIDLTGTSTNQITIRDMTFDFNSAGQSAYTCPNSGWIIQNVADTGQALPPSANRVSLMHNEFKNAACQAVEWISADGIIVDNYIHDNHEGLFLTGVQSQRLVVTGNIITNTGTSGPNNAGIDLEDRAQNITVSDNVLRGPGGASGTGIDLEPANQTTIVANTICCYLVGVGVSGPGAVGSVFNTVTGNTITDNANDGIKVNHSSEQGTVITGNTLRNNGGGSTDQVQILVTASGPDIVISGNSIVDTRSGAARCVYGVWVTGTNQVTVATNVVDGFKSQGIRIENSNFVTVEGNVAISSGFNGVVIAGTSNNGVFTNNNVRQATPMLINSQTGNIILNNAGFNPIGAVTNFVENTGNTANPNSGTTTPTSATTYTVRMVPMQLIIIGGTVTAIVVNGKTIATVATTEVIEMAIGDTFSITFSVAPTWQATFR